MSAVRTAALMATCTWALALAPPGADASRDLNRSERRAILTSVQVEAPNGRRITDSTCIAGRLSTVDRRWAMFYLSNTPSCVERYGGASGESSLVRRNSPRSKRWKRRGSIGDNCERGTGGASDAVLRDLGCSFIP